MIFRQVGFYVLFYSQWLNCVIPILICVVVGDGDSILLFIFYLHVIFSPTLGCLSQDFKYCTNLQSNVIHLRVGRHILYIVVGHPTSQFYPLDDHNLFICLQSILMATSEIFTLREKHVLSKTQLWSTNHKMSLIIKVNMLI